MSKNPYTIWLELNNLPYQGVTRALFQGVSFKMIDGKEASKIEGDDDDNHNGGDYIDPNA